MAPRVGLAQIDARFAALRTTLGLGPGLDFHSLRRSYVTHLIEAGWDPLFVQHQVGHEHASTTAIYTCVSSDFRTRTLRRALDATLAQATMSAATNRQHGQRDRSCDRAGAADDPPPGQLPVAAARDHGQPRAVHHHPPRAAAAPNAASTLSASQIHRLVTGTPERLSLPVLAALCDLLEVTPAELIVTSAENATTRKTAGAGPTAVPGPAELRPTRARLRPER